MIKMRALVVASTLTAATVGAPGSGTLAQATACLAEPAQTRMDLGAPNAEGNTQSARLSDPSASVGFQFTVTQPTAAASLYVGDQWFDIDLYLYARGRCGPGTWDQVIRAWSVHAERRVLQFMRPDEQIVNLPQGEYEMLAQYKPPDNPGAADPFDPARAFTARVALAPPYCGLAPADVLVPNPVAPAVLVPKRPDDALYQLGVSIDPPEQERGPFSLLTFSAFVSPPYIDLYDFAWQVDGTSMPDVTIGTLQVAATDLPRVAGDQHRVRVTGVGAREYPDPTLTHIPPTLSVECAFRTSAARAPAGPAPSKPAPPVR